MIALAFDVGPSPAGTERWRQSGRLFLPPGGITPKAALVTLPGGTYDKRYWHLEVPGRDDYSFARYMAARGYMVVCVDHLGIGESTVPGPGQVLTLEVLAAADLAVARQVRERLESGTLHDAVAPSTIPVVGIGHSMGACLTIMVQSSGSAYDGVVLLGYGVHLGQDETLVEQSLTDRIAGRRARLQEIAGFADDANLVDVPREHLRDFFYAADVPDQVVAADAEAAVPAPLPAAYEVTAAGFASRYAERITVPVFLGFGEDADTSADPHMEPAHYPGARDVTLFTLPDSAHCHNFAGTRAGLWNRIASWLESASLRNCDEPSATAR
ncbi:MAG: alpha/beta hydrolase [Solirubrobacterales bacterium]